MKILYLGPKSRISEHLGLKPRENKINYINPEAFDVVISNRYRYILSKDCIEGFRPNRIINIHAAMLPWQRGVHPIFWAIEEQKPVGVTIHDIDAGVDTGPIIIQKPLDIPYHYTFRNAWIYVNEIATHLFLALWPNLLNAISTIQPMGGSLHKLKDINERYPWMDWDMTIDSFLRRKYEMARGRDCEEDRRWRV